MNPFQTGYGSVRAWNDTVKNQQTRLSMIGLPRLTNAANIGLAVGALIGIVLFIAFGSALIAPIANFTTGIVTAHTGFTPNPNVTGSPGVSALLPLLPLAFVGLLFIGALAAYGVKFDFDG